MADTRRQFLQRVVVAAPGLGVAFSRWRALIAAEPTTSVEPQAPKWLGELRRTKEWQKLDALWDEMSTHGGPNMRWPRDADEQAAWKGKGKAFEALKLPLADALDAVAKRMAKLGAADGSANALRVLCMRRHYHIWRSRYSMATCYSMTYIGGLNSSSCAGLEKQFASLQQLKARGKLTPGAMAKAAKLIAERAEILSQTDSMQGHYDREKWEALMAKIDRQTGGLKPDVPLSQQATDCASMVVELARE